MKHLRDGKSPGKTLRTLSRARELSLAKSTQQVHGERDSGFKLGREEKRKVFCVENREFASFSKGGVKKRVVGLFGFFFLL